MNQRFGVLAAIALGALGLAACGSSPSAVALHELAAAGGSTGGGTDGGSGGGTVGGAPASLSLVETDPGRLVHPADMDQDVIVADLSFSRDASGWKGSMNFVTPYYLVQADQVRAAEAQIPASGATATLLFDVSVSDYDGNVVEIPLQMEVTLARPVFASDGPGRIAYRLLHRDLGLPVSLANWRNLPDSTPLLAGSRLRLE